MTEQTPFERARENITGMVSVLVTAIWLGALFTGQDWWLAFMLVGYIAIIPITAMLFGDEEDVEEHWDDATNTTVETESSTESTEEDPLDTLRDRYARGELTDEQFERKLERLLETETLEDVEDRARTIQDEVEEAERERETESAD